MSDEMCDRTYPIMQMVDIQFPHNYLSKLVHAPTEQVLGADRVSSGALPSRITGALCASAPGIELTPRLTQQQRWIEPFIIGVRSIARGA